MHIERTDVSLTHEEALLLIAKLAHMSVGSENGKFQSSCKIPCTRTDSNGQDYPSFITFNIEKESNNE